MSSFRYTRFSQVKVVMERVLLRDPNDHSEEAALDIANLCDLALDLVEERDEALRRLEDIERNRHIRDLE